jgi:hypothetical protein
MGIEMEKDFVTVLYKFQVYLSLKPKFVEIDFFLLKKRFQRSIRERTDKILPLFVYQFNYNNMGFK